jgi:hypothetical protein
MYLARNVDSKLRAASANRQLLLFYCCGGFGFSNYGGPWIDPGAAIHVRCSSGMVVGPLVTGSRVQSLVNRTDPAFYGVAFLSVMAQFIPIYPSRVLGFRKRLLRHWVDSTRYWGGTPHSASRDSDACLCFDWGTEMEIDEECLGSEPREKCGLTRYLGESHVSVKRTRRSRLLINVPEPHSRWPVLR